jgi:peptidoglycan/LPS O-acetylase OafA/YrhL
LPIATGPAPNSDRIGDVATTHQEASAPRLDVESFGSLRFYELDSLRGLAALVVALSHFSLAVGTGPNNAFGRMNHFPFRILFAGHESVILFFTLSGFVLTLPYMRSRDLRYLPYLLKRFCRIYLPYLAALMICVLCAMRFHDTVPGNDFFLGTWSKPVEFPLVLQHVLFLGNYQWSQFSNSFWSLIYEMRVSLLFPFIAMAVLRLGNRWSLVCAILLSSVANPLAMLCAPLSQTHAEGGGFFASLFDPRTFLTLHYAAFFILGSMMAKNQVRLRSWFAGVSKLTGALLGVFAFVVFQLATKAGPYSPGFLDPTQLPDWVAFPAAGLFIVFSLGAEPFQKFLRNPLIHHLGKISYSFYLMHGVVLFVMIHTLYGKVAFLNLLPVYLAGTFIVSEIFYRFVEKPTMDLGRRLTRP